MPHSTCSADAHISVSFTSDTLQQLQLERPRNAPAMLVHLQSLFIVQPSSFDWINKLQTNVHAHIIYLQLCPFHSSIFPSVLFSPSVLSPLSCNAPFTGPKFQYRYYHQGFLFSFPFWQGSPNKFSITISLSCNYNFPSAFFIFCTSAISFFLSNIFPNSTAIPS